MLTPSGIQTENEEIEINADSSAFACSEEVVAVLKKVQLYYENRLMDTEELIKARDEIVDELKSNLEMKEIELDKLAKELGDRNSQNDIYRRCAETRILTMERQLEEKDRKIGKLKALTNLKTLKINLLQMRLEFLESQGEANGKSYSLISNEEKCPLREKSSHHYMKICRAKGSGDHCQIVDDTFEFLDEISQLRDDIENSTDKSVKEESIQLIERIKDIKQRVFKKLRMNKEKRAELKEIILNSSSRFNQAQTDIEEIRRTSANDENSREQIRYLVTIEKELIGIIESSEVRKRVVVARIHSFKKALLNLDSLEKILLESTQE